METKLTLLNENCFFVDYQRSYSQWLSDVNHHASKITAINSHNWLLYEEDPYQFSVLFFALLQAGKDICLPQNGCELQIKIASADVDGFAGTLFADRAICIPFETVNHQCFKAIEVNAERKVTFFTSGSTGEPKKVEKAFIQLITEVNSLQQVFGAKVKDCCFVATVSHQHIYGLLFKLLWPVWCGHKLICQQQEYPEHLVHAVAKHALDKVCLISSPAHFSRLVKDNVYQSISDKLTAMFSSGGPLLPDTKALLLEQLGHCPIEVFGSTETGGIAWKQRNDLAIEPSWQTFPDINIEIEAETQQLLIQSPYLNSRQWYLTDDRAEIVTVGQFNLLGRSDRIVKIEEKRVSLDQVQQALKTLEFVDDCYCLTVQRHRGVQIAAVIVLSAVGQVFYRQHKKLQLNRALQEALRLQLENIAIPKRFRYINALPYNAAGKLAKKDMEQFFD